MGTLVGIFGIVVVPCFVAIVHQHSMFSRPIESLGNYAVRPGPPWSLQEPGSDRSRSTLVCRGMLVVPPHAWNHRHTLRNLDPFIFHGLHLFRVVSEKAARVDAQVPQDGTADIVASSIR